VAREWNEETLGAIRRNVPDPPGHARNLFHVAVAMYNAWAAWDGEAVGYGYDEKGGEAGDVAAARREAVSYAAHRVLRVRFGVGVGSGESVAAIDARLVAQGYRLEVAMAPVVAGGGPGELGKRCGEAVLTWSQADGFDQKSYPQPYTWQVNPNLLRPLSVLGVNGMLVPNMPLGYGIPEGTDPNFWQPLDLSASVTQNGLPQPGGAQNFVGVQGLATMPFSLEREHAAKPWLDPFGGPSRLSLPGQPSATDGQYREGVMDVLRSSSQLNDGNLVDISPGSWGGNPLGEDSGQGYSQNPYTGLPYASNRVRRGDFVRVLAEYWADGPHSETPPGHWHVLANEVADDPQFTKRMRGVGRVLDDLEWDVKMYFALSAATHDAACAAWSLKRYYSGVRPITAVRYMASRGQSGDPGQPSYDPAGLPLEPGVVELVTGVTAAPGGRHERIWDVRSGMEQPGIDYQGQVVVRSWPGEHPLNLPAPAVAAQSSPVRWMLGRDWLPFQRKTFNTPAFPGYVSGHSTFSRAAAEVLTLLTGSRDFPGGFHRHVFRANTMQIDRGPSADVELQWCSYFDAADQAGQSRRWGGIHVPEDDFHGRRIGSEAGQRAFALAERYWTGSVAGDPEAPSLEVLPEGVRLKWRALRGAWYRVQTSADLVTWVDAGPLVRSYDTAGVWTDAKGPSGRRYYRVQRRFSPDSP
jgi:hypothetical protein